MSQATDVSLAVLLLLLLTVPAFSVAASSGDRFYIIPGGRTMPIREYGSHWAWG